MRFEYIKLGKLNIFSENRVLFEEKDPSGFQLESVDEDGEKLGMAEARDLFDVIFRKVKVGQSPSKRAEEALTEKNPYLDQLLKFARENSEQITDARYDKPSGVLTLDRAGAQAISIPKGSDLFKAIFWPKEEPTIFEYPWQKQSGDVATDLMTREPAADNAAEIARLERLKRGEFSEQQDIAVDGKDVVDPTTGYKIRIFAPKSWDGTLDVYFPGDTYSIDLATSSKHLRQKFVDKCKGGKMSALAVIEGDRSKIHQDKENRYADLKAPGSLNSLLDTVGNNLGNEVSSVNFMGHSRGGSAINYILQSGAEAAKISTISCLDSTYWTATPLIAFARRGGQLNIAFKPNPPKPPGTVGPAREVIRALGLTKIAPNHWTSADGKVNVYEAPELNHSSIADKYAGIFMGSEHHETRTYTVEQSAQAAGEVYVSPEVQASPPGALHFSIFEKTESADVVSHEKEDMTALTSSNIEDIRFNSGLLTKTTKETPNEQKAISLKQETYRRIRAYTSTRDKEWYAVDYAKMGADSKGQSHEEFIGLGDILLDPDIKDILVYRGGEVVKAHRGVVSAGKHAGRIGFLDESGQYVATHTGDKFRILTAEESSLTSEQYLGAITSEETQRESGRASFAANPESYSDGAGYYAGKTEVRDVPPKEYTGNDKEIALKPKGFIPPEVQDRYVQMMGHREALTYYERMMGRPPKGGWLVKGPLNVFGSTVNRPNIILACLLVELEQRCKKMGMDLKFKNMSSTANKPLFHGLGMAIDFDASDNWVRKPGETTWTLPLAMAEEMQRMGFKWGMYFYKSRKDGCTDAMHFDIRTSLPNAMAMLSGRALEMAQSYQAPGKGMSLYDYGKSLGGQIH